MAKSRGGAALLVAALVSGCGSDPFEAQPFTPAAWAVADQIDRAAMTRDAIRHLPPGTPEADIRSLLGPGEVVEMRQQARRFGEGGFPPGTVRTHIYYLGCWSWRYYDSTFLYVHVGANGQLLVAVIGGGQGRSRPHNPYLFRPPALIPPTPPQVSFKSRFRRQ